VRSGGDHWWVCSSCGEFARRLPLWKGV